MIIITTIIMIIIKITITIIVTILNESYNFTFSIVTVKFYEYLKKKCMIKIPKS